MSGFIISHMLINANNNDDISDDDNDLRMCMSNDQLFYRFSLSPIYGQDLRRTFDYTFHDNH